MNANILWVDDEIELLKPHLLFLQGKGYNVESCNNGYDAIDIITDTRYDLIILDEMMPGMTGLETLAKIKEIRPDTPVVMVTKSEEENIMDRAVGSKIADYLIKPVNPNQVLLSIKKNLHADRLVSQTNTADYREQFAQINAMLSEARSFDDWTAIYKKLVGWDIELTESSDKSMREVLGYQKTEAGSEYAKFIRRNYEEWFRDKTLSRPVMSHTLMRNKVFPLVEKHRKVTFMLIDNFRYDQWLMIRPLMRGFCDVAAEEFYCSILPTATQYARNALFAGLTPAAIEKIMPGLWLGGGQEQIRGGFSPSSAPVVGA